MRIRFMPLVGFALFLIAGTAARGAPGAAPSDAARPAPRPISGPKEKPRPGDSRFPAEHPRPAGALLGRLPPGLVLEKERLALRCQAPGGGCQVRHAFRLRNAGPARRVVLTVVTATYAVHAEVEGARLDWEPTQDATATPAPPTAPGTAPSPGAPEARPPARTWRSGGRAVAPGRPAPFSLPGRTRSRPVLRRRLAVTFAAGAQQTVTLVSHSVGGFDRSSRRRTQAEVAFIGTRRPDYFTYHHELRLRDPEARQRPGGAGGAVALELEIPADLEWGAEVGLRCTRRGATQRCTAQIPPGRDRLLVALGARYHRPVGFFASVGVGVTRQGAEAWLRVGISLMLRRHLDLLTLTGETDAQTRFGLALVYQLFSPYNPNNLEMGAHGELGLVLDVVPAVRPAIRLGGAFHVGFIRINALLDVYPGELKNGDGPAWRVLVGAGLGL